MTSRHLLRGVQLAATALVVAVALLSVDSIEPREARALTTISATTWQVHVNDNIYLSPYLGNVHGHPTQFDVAPPIPAADDPSWANCGPGAPTRYSIHGGNFSMCPSDTSIGMQGGSILPGCWVNLNFTYYQAFVSIPSSTSISTFTVNLSGADDGAQIKIFNSRYPDGVVPTGGNIYQGTPQSTANLASYARAGEWNRIVIQQVDDCIFGNNLQSATISIDGAIVPPPPPDTTPPVVTPIITGTLGDNGWYRSNVSLRWSVSDPEASPTSLIKLGCSSASVTEDSFGVSVTCRATSNGGTTQETVTIKRDATPPTVTVLRQPAANSSGWNNGDVTLQFMGADMMSGIASCTPSTTIGEGAGQSFTGTCTDKAGNVASVMVPNINVDKTRPVITAEPTTPANENGWHNTPVTVRFVCSDPGGSGFAAGACPQDQVISNEGMTFVQGKTVTDRAGNTSFPSPTIGVRIDTVAPTASASRTPEPNANGWNNMDITVSFGGSDGNSGIASCSPAVVLGEGTGQSAGGTCTDRAGNVSAPASVSNINVDKTRPTITAAATSAPNGTGWYTSDVTVQYTCTDAGGSGLPSGACPPDQVISTEGITTTPAHTVTDVAGNVSDPSNAIVVKIDKTNPTATATAAPAANGNGWNNTDVTVTFSGTDAASGIASCSAPVVLGEGAGQSASGTCTDNAGHVSAPATASNINVDKTKPVVTLTGVTNGAAYTANGVPTAGCATTDALSGVATSATVSTVGGPVGTVTVTCAGATDRAGNAAAAVTATYTVTYAFCGFSQPVLVPVQEFKAGSTIPVKFCLKDASAAVVTTATGTVEAYVNGVLKGTVAFRFSDGQYIANVQTKDGRTDWPAGTLELRVRLNDGTTHSTNTVSTAGP
jgi:hypothetical protein